MGNVLAKLRLHPRAVAAVAAALAVLATVAVFAARSRPAGGCAAAPPIPDLPSQLRSIGGFDQPFTDTDVRTLQDAAARAASALHGDLAQTAVGEPVDIAAAR